jgi:photosystem II stability/assembly factor-like uncharacterized protein
LASGTSERKLPKRRASSVASKSTDTARKTRRLDAKTVSTDPNFKEALAEVAIRDPKSHKLLATELARLKAKEETRELRRADQPDKAQEFYAMKRSPDGKSAIPVERYLTAVKQMEGMPQYSTALNRVTPSRSELKAQAAKSVKSAAQTGDVQANAATLAEDWTPLGPGNIGGRTRAILIHPTQPDIMYAGGVAGGVWKTTTGGARWFPLTDTLANIAVCSLAMSPNDPNVIYAGTGEGFFNGDAVRGAGIFKTTNGGASWTRLAATAVPDFFFVNDIVVSSSNPNRVYAGTRTGIFRSLDAGATWTNVFSTAVTGGCLDLAIRTDTTADFIFATIGTFVQASILRNTDAGGAGAWQTVFTEPAMGRTTLAIAPSNQNIVYALASSVDQNSDFFLGLHGVFRSTNGGEPGSWTARVRNTDPVKLNTVLLSNPVFAFFTDCGFGPTDFFFNQGWYDNVIAVDPVNPDRVFTAGVDMFRSDDGGANWGQMGHWFADPSNPRFIHADHHVITFHPRYNGTTNQIIYAGTDGGVTRTDNALAAVTTNPLGPCSTFNGDVTWTTLNNGYAVTQFYHGAAYPDGRTYFGGTQDNGTVRGKDAVGQDSWTSLLGGDGAYVAVDPTNTDNIYGAFQNAAFVRSTDGGVTFSDATSGLNDDSFMFITPNFMDPNVPQRFWTGGRNMWRSVNGQRTWTQASAPLFPDNVGRSVGAIAISPTDPNLILAGRNDGVINRTNVGLTSDATTIWTSTRPRGGFVSWLTFDPNDPTIAYATYSSFGGAHVWKSVNGGASFTPIDGTGTNVIPDIPVHCIVVDPTNSARLFVGTDLGVFTTTDGGANWMPENDGFANTVTESLSLIGNTLFAFTHGRGAYRVTLQPTINARPVVLAQPQSRVVNANQSVTLTVNAAGAGPMNFQWFMGESPNTASPIAGATNASFTTPALSATTQYWVRVSNAAGAVSSATATLTVLNDGCAAAISPVRRDFAASGGSGSVTVNIAAGCAWNLIADVPPWLTLIGNPSNVGPGTVTYQVAPNSTGVPRSAVLSVAGQSHVITQEAATLVNGQVALTINSVSNPISVNPAPGSGYVNQVDIRATLTNNGAPIFAPLAFQVVEIAKQGADLDPSRPFRLMTADDFQTNGQIVFGGRTGSIQTALMTNNVIPTGGQMTPINFSVLVGTPQRFRFLVSVFAGATAPLTARHALRKGALIGHLEVTVNDPTLPGGEGVRASFIPAVKSTVRAAASARR